MKFYRNLIMGKITLDFAIRITGCPVKKSDFESLFKKTLANLPKIPVSGEIHFVIVDDEEISFINGAYRGENTSTDVISLSYLDEDSFPQNNLIGEVLVSLETAQRQAKENRITVKAELQGLFVHGLLHIFGFDHNTAAKKKEMSALQEKILGKKFMPRG
jgi:probable rRNA maturation factor